MAKKIFFMRKTSLLFALSYFLIACSNKYYSNFENKTHSYSSGYNKIFDNLKVLLVDQNFQINYCNKEFGIIKGIKKNQMILIFIRRKDMENSIVTVRLKEFIPETSQYVNIERVTILNKDEYNNFFNKLDHLIYDFKNNSK